MQTPMNNITSDTHSCVFTANDSLTSCCVTSDNVISGIDNSCAISVDISSVNEYSSWKVVLEDSYGTYQYPHETYYPITYAVCNNNYDTSHVCDDEPLFNVKRRRKINIRFTV